MSLDWNAVGSMLGGLGTIAGVAAVVWAANRATATWKDQKRAENRLEAAKQIITATHKGKSALAYVRGVLMHGSELAQAEEKLKEDPDWSKNAGTDRGRRIIMAQAYYNRLTRTRDDMAALDDCLPMARALFGEELEAAVAKLRRQFWLVQVDVDAYVDDDGADPEFTKKIRRGMYDVKARPEQKNEVTDAIQDAVTKIERICEPALRLAPPPRLPKIV